VNAERDIVQETKLMVYATSRYTISDITAQDANALIEVLNSVGGSPEGPRGFASRMLTALAGAGLNIEPDVPRGIRTVGSVELEAA
jgi:hypothetical protein